MLARKMVRSALAVVSAAAILAASSIGVACPFCGPPEMTLSEQFAKADAAILVQWVKAVEPEGDNPGSTTYEIVQAARAPFKSIEKGKAITLNRYRSGKKGELSLIFGSRSKGDLIEWGFPLEVTETLFNYIVQAPPPESALEKRLAYFLKFLEFPDRAIAIDAYQEFANAPYKQIAAIAKELPREKIRKWVTSPDVPASRLGLYGLLLGMCGSSEDAPMMEEKIVVNTDDFRLGIDGVMAGYLLLTGDKGLDVIDATKIREKKAAFSETYAAMQALRFMWTYGNSRIAPERLRSSMRQFLDRPELADIVIADLARWKDWSLQKRLMELYGTEEYNVPSIKRAIVRFMIASTKDLPGGGGQELPQHAVDGSKYLEQLRAKDPKVVSEAERYFFLQ